MDGEGHTTVVRQPSSEERLEEVSIALTAAHEVNTHLNAEIERLTAELAATRAEDAAYHAHIRDLSKKLVQARRDGAGVLDSDQDGVLHGDVKTSASGVEHVSNSDGEGEARGRDMASAQDATLAADSPAWQRVVMAADSLGLLLDREEVELGEELGRGTFGTTHAGSWRGGAVAVKRVRVADADGALLLERELKAAAQTRHPHLLALYGACLTDPGDAWLLMELAQGGTLGRWLHGPPSALRPPRRDRRERLGLALDVARGLLALSHACPPVLHRDVKPSNVFVFAGNTNLSGGWGGNRAGASVPPPRAKLSDLGLARSLGMDAAAGLTGETGTYLYMSPENMRHEDYGPPSDVWSWGVLAVEALTQRTPYADLHLAPVQVALAVAAGELRPKLPPDCPPQLAQLLNSVLDPDPDARPGFGMIVARLEAILERGLDVSTPAPAASVSGLQPLAQLVGSWGINMRWPNRATRG